jgi:hypothetical protein
MLLTLVPPGVEPEGDDVAVAGQLSRNGLHQGRLAGAPIAEDADREPWLAFPDDPREGPGVLVKAQRRLLRGIVQENLVVVHWY